MSSVTTSPATTGNKLQRGLGRNFALATILGGVIGLGILRTPGEIAGVVQDPWIFLSLWLFGGLFVLLSTSVVAELVGMTNRSGGTYTLVRRAFGPFPGFVIGWVDWLGFVADIALKAVVVMEFITILVPAALTWQTPLAILLSTLFAVLQIRGVGVGARIQQFAASFIALIIIALALTLLFAEPLTSLPAAAAPAPETGLAAWSLVATAIIFTYDGWLFAAYFSGEVVGGSGAVARTCIKGMVLIIGLYVLLMGSLVFSVPLSSLAGSDLALAQGLELAVSPAAATIVVLAAIVILLAHQNLLYMGAPRVLHALAQDGLAFKRTHTVASGGNPLVAVLLSWAVATGLILVGGFEFLLYLCVFFFVVIYIVLIAGVLILRRRQPDSERPYRAWGHPWSTWFCLVAWTIIAAFQTVAEPETALYALAMIAVSWPVYRYLIRYETGSEEHQ
ncbi:MAG: APC family permease [Proteobacteria bacterium]|nr:APC family permease [Pseudomonadota bacterium]